MPTTPEEKPAKSRQRNRKTNQRNPKVEQKAEAAPEADPVSAVIAPIEAVAVEPVAVEEAAPEVAPVAATVQAEREAALSGEVLLPEGREHAPRAIGLVAIAEAHGEYLRQSWLTGRALVERLVAVRSLDEAIQIQDEFAKQAYANFVAQSERICGLYGGWAQQLFAPIGKSPA